MSGSRSFKYLGQIMLAAFFAWIAFDQFQQNFMLKKNSKVPSINFDNAKNDGTMTLPLNDKYNILYFFKPNTFVSDLTNFSVNIAKNFLPEDVQLVGIAIDFESQEKLQDYVAKKLIIPVVMGGSITQKIYKLEKFPVFYMINKQNTVKFKTAGFTTPFGIALRSYGIMDDSVEKKWWLNF